MLVFRYNNKKVFFSLTLDNKIIIFRKKILIKNTHILFLFFLLLFLEKLQQLLETTACLSKVMLVTHSTLALRSGFK